jgi:hypothetical protein
MESQQTRTLNPLSNLGGFSYYKSQKPGILDLHSRIRGEKRIS